MLVINNYSLPGKWIRTAQQGDMNGGAEATDAGCTSLVQSHMVYGL